jgi:hypothetical protein
LLRNVHRVLPDGLSGERDAAKRNENGTAHFSEIGSDI